MKTLEIGAVRGRHEMPVNKFVFNEAITNFDIKAIEDHVNTVLDKEVFLCDGETFDAICLYVTGLTVVTVSVVKWCFNNDVTLSLMHYDNEKRDYVEQFVYDRSW